MKKYKSSFCKPYIRKIKSSDMGGDLRTAIRLGFFKDKGYVLVQRGTNHILDVDKSKHRLKRKILVVDSNKDFNKWANDIKKYCQNN